MSPGPLCSTCSTGPLAQWCSFQGATLCPSCAELAIEAWKREQRVQAACVAMSRVLVFVAMEALARKWERSVGETMLLDECRAAALRDAVLCEGRLRLEWPR